MLTHLLVALAMSGAASPSSECVSQDDQGWQGEALVCTEWTVSTACGEVVVTCPNVGDDTHNESSFTEFALLADGSMRVWY